MSSLLPTGATLASSNVIRALTLSQDHCEELSLISFTYTAKSIFATDDKFVNCQPSMS